jgi:hypothetical protein
MIGRVLILGLFLAGVIEPRGEAVETAADRVTLRDGSVVLGLVTSTTAGPGGSLEFLVRRAWAGKNLKGHLARWNRSNAASVQQAIELHQKRLAAWRRERATGVGPDDRILQWIDQELRRLAAPGDQQESILLRVRLSRSEVRGLERRPATAERLLRLAWHSGLPEPETMPLDELRGALAARGYAADAAERARAISLDRLLPPAAEPEMAWLARRAATEVTIDPSLRFLRYQDMVIPDSRSGQPMGDLGLTTALAELKRLLDPDQGQGRPDPVAERLNSLATRGRCGATVTRLTIAPDLGSVTVECTLWVRTGVQRWIPFGTRSATIRPDDLEPQVGGAIAEDPQVQGVFRIVEGLGLGAIAPELKQRSLRIGAATQRALETARSAFDQDLDALALPVLEPARDVAEGGARNADPEPGPKATPRRRSMLGPPDR